MHDHLTHGDLSRRLVYDAIRVRLIEIGEAVKAIDADLLATEPGIPWRDARAALTKRRRPLRGP